ncbi:MAG: hypothetical protein ACR2QV_15815 [Gammaproteobacteria bacterium]
MIDATNRGVAEQLRKLPDLRPPANAWARIAARARRRRPLAWSGAALAACAAAFAIFMLVRQEPPAAPVETFLVDARPSEQEPSVSVSSVRRASSSADVGALRRQSRSMERLLGGLPSRSGGGRPDLASAISDLQRRIVAVDYELNRVEQRRMTRAPSALRRWPVEPRSADWPDGRQVAEVPPVSRDLWQHRVELMDRLVRARFVEAGAEAY